jgi:hypothetical protein
VISHTKKLCEYSKNQIDAVESNVKKRNIITTCNHRNEYEQNGIITSQDNYPPALQSYNMELTELIKYATYVL